jgi:NAD(P)-dependent dehydrogenase (short-subunit alcohol dehydrogenase family)
MKRRSGPSSPPTTRPPHKGRDVAALRETRPHHRRLERHRPGDRDGAPRKGCQSRNLGPTLALVSSALTELRGAGGEAVGIVADVGRAEGRTETLRRALDALGGLDILINSADDVRAGRLLRLRLRSRRC